MEEDRRSRGHPLLRSKKRQGGGGGYSHGFSQSQIQSLAVICQTLLPPPPETRAEQEAVDTFDVASRSKPPFTDEVPSLYPLFSSVDFLNQDPAGY